MKYTLIFHWNQNNYEEEIYTVNEASDPGGEVIKADCAKYNDNLTADRRKAGYYKVSEK